MKFKRINIKLIYLKLIISPIIKLIKNHNNIVSDTGDRMKKRLLIDEMINYIEKNLTNDISVESISEQFGYSIRHIQRFFKKETHVKLYGYITYRKMINILVEMKKGSSPIEDIYEKYGYKSYDSFLRAFKRVFNTTPTRIELNKVEIVYVKVTPSLIVPYVYSSSCRKYELKRKSFIDLYLQVKDLNISTYMIKLTNKGDSFINVAKQFGFGDSYILDYDLTRNVVIANSKWSNDQKSVNITLADNSNISIAKQLHKLLYQNNKISFVINVDDISIKPSFLTIFMYRITEFINKAQDDKYNYNYLLNYNKNSDVDFFVLKQKLYKLDDLDFMFLHNKKELFTLIYVEKKNEKYIDNVLNKIRDCKNSNFNYKIMFDETLENEVGILLITK